MTWSALGAWEGADGAEVSAPARGTTPTGFFTKSDTERGRTRLREKMGPFLKLLDTARAQLSRPGSSTVACCLAKAKT